MLQQLEKLHQEALQIIEKITDAAALSEWESKYFGRKGDLTTLLGSIGKLPKEERAEFGKRANEVKDSLTHAYEGRTELIHLRELAQKLEEGEIDVTMPG